MNLTGKKPLLIDSSTTNLATANYFTIMIIDQGDCHFIDNELATVGLEI